MGTVAELDAALVNLVDTTLTALAGKTATRMGSDSLRDEAIAAGAYKLQIRYAIPAQIERQSNLSYPQVEVELELHHKLADPTDERAYTITLQPLIAGSLAFASSWRDMTPVHEVDEGPGQDGPAVRVGNVVSFTVTARVELTPP